MVEFMAKKAFVWTDDLIAELISKVFVIYIKELIEWIDYSIRIAIDTFYDNYDPHHYHRNYKLYTAYKLEVSNNGLHCTVNSTNMENAYRVKTNYIYEIAFEGVDGYVYHGGATKGTDHPNPGVPYWRSGEHFSKWGQRAARMTPTIEEMISENLNEINFIGIYNEILLKEKRKYERKGGK